MGQRQKRIRQKERQDKAEEQAERRYRKWDQTDSPEIPANGGRHQKSLGLPSGAEGDASLVQQQSEGSGR